MCSEDFFVCLKVAPLYKGNILINGGILNKNFLEIDLKIVLS
jgi:hypothetical protein